MNAASSQNPAGQRENQDHQPNQGTPPDHEEQAYFGAQPGGLVEGNNSALKLAVIALLIIGATTVSLALIFRSVDKSANSSNATSALTEHNKLMREAMQMAREAQEMNRRKMMEMRRAMEEAEGYAEYGDYPGAQDFSSDP